MKNKVVKTINILIEELERLDSMEIDVSSRTGQKSEIERARAIKEVSAEIAKLVKVSKHVPNIKKISDINTDIELNK